MSDSTPKFGENPPPGKYGRMTLLPHAGPGNLATGEPTRPVVTPVQRVRSHFLADATIPGNVAPVELARPVADTGSEILSPPADPLPPEAEPQIGHIARVVGELLDRTPPAERAQLLRRLQGLLARLSAEQSAA